jgi:hypothetical protein
MAKLPPERLAKALRANLQRRKQGPSPAPARGAAKDPENLKETPSFRSPPPGPEGQGR